MGGGAVTRKCRLKSCKRELPKTKDCTDIVQKKGFCGYDCLTEYGRIKAQEQRERQERKRRQEIKRKDREIKRSDIRWQHKQCQKSFNRMRVLEELKWFKDRGLEPECISCAKKNMDWCCGHFKTVGAQSNLRYDRMNTYLQCNRYCNKALSGNIEGNKTTRGYKQGLADRFGEEEAARIIEYCESNTAPAQWDWREMEQWRKEWNRRIRELEKEL